MQQLPRRQFVKASAALAGLAVMGGLGLGRSVGASTTYGPLLRPDSNGVRLPAGFRSRIIATTGQEVGSTGYRWHPNPDGGATFAHPDGGWIYVSNDEAPDGAGGVSMVRFDTAGTIVDARSILSGSNRNCAGGPTPWQTWLSCEETASGRVWECDPFGLTPPVVRPAMGVFKHEAAAADPVRKVIYLTEDEPDGGLYRFAPDRWGDLSEGRLEIMTESAGKLGWQAVPDPAGAAGTTRLQVPTTKRFAGGEGAWFEDPFLYFTTKGDNRVWRYQPETSQLTVLYDIAVVEAPVLRGVDNLTLNRAGELFVCEDGDNMEVVVLTADSVEPFLRLDILESEMTGVAFDPSGTRLYVSSQRNPGATYEITGPFNRGTGAGTTAGAGAGTNARGRSRPRSSSTAGGPR